MGEWRTFREILFVLSNLTLEFSVTHIINKLDISAFQITCVKWHRKWNTVSRNEIKVHSIDRLSPSVWAIPVTIAVIQST
jgi:hypothetical protein